MKRDGGRREPGLRQALRGDLGCDRVWRGRVRDRVGRSRVRHEGKRQGRAGW